MLARNMGIDLFELVFLSIEVSVSTQQSEPAKRRLLPHNSRFFSFGEGGG